MDNAWFVPASRINDSRTPEGDDVDMPVRSCASTSAALHYSMAGRKRKERQLLTPRLTAAW